jgi:hypothetical protein
MAITYSTTITYLKGAPTLGSLSNVITEVEFEVTAVDGDYTHNALGHILLDYDAEDFTAFEDVTEEMVIGWCEAHGMYDNVCKGLVSFIDKMKMPTSLKMDKPWA